jgi:NTE family protein
MRFFKSKRPKIGLALGSGAARGLAHIGVLRALIEEGISVDMIAGSSMGALVGACYARKGEIAGLEELVLKTDWKQLVRLAD